MSATGEHPGENAIYLSPEAMATAEKIRLMANLDSIEDAIRIALGDELYVREQINKGRSLLLKDKDNYWELDWKSQR
jgi:hypothetical protein